MACIPYGIPQSAYCKTIDELALLAFLSTYNHHQGWVFSTLRLDLRLTIASNMNILLGQLTALLEYFKFINSTISLVSLNLRNPLYLPMLAISHPCLAKCSGTETTGIFKGFYNQFEVYSQSQKRGAWLVYSTCFFNARWPWQGGNCFLQPFS